MTTLVTGSLADWHSKARRTTVLVSVETEQLTTKTEYVLVCIN
jgi:hypothetical protein